MRAQMLAWISVPISICNPCQKMASVGRGGTIMVAVILQVVSDGKIEHVILRSRVVEIKNTNASESQVTNIALVASRSSKLKKFQMAHQSSLRHLDDIFQSKRTDDNRSWIIILITILHHQDSLNNRSVVRRMSLSKGGPSVQPSPVIE